jgi:tRNA modification GTPase
MSHSDISRTIAAIATPIGEAGVAMIRVSGKNAFSIVNTLFSKDLDTLVINQMTYGKLIAKDQTTIDDVMLVKLKAPRSFTGEDTVEIFCHGSLLIQKKIMTSLIDAGATHALPGEFSYQAFMNGKMDLSQAEAIQQLISAKNDYALKAAEDQLKGHLSQKILTIRQDLIEIAAIIDAWVDYPEEGLEFKSQEEILVDLHTVLQQVDRLIETFHDGKKLSYGIKLCLLGAPNAGKSSLMNALLGYDRAIVTPIAGTTRDILQEDLHLFGMNFRLIDTAGIRQTDEIIEKEGIKRSLLASEEADLILYVIDSTTSLTNEEQTFISSLDPTKTILVFNKADLHKFDSSLFPFFSVHVSAKTAIGLDHLKQAIEGKIWKNGTPPKEEIIITKERHFEALKDCSQNLHQVINGLKSGISCEFISFDLRMALKSLSSIIGFDLTESILDSIFSKFCVGK